MSDLNQIGEPVRENYRRQGDRRTLERLATMIDAIEAKRIISSNGGFYSQTLSFTEIKELLNENR